MYFHLCYFLSTTSYTTPPETYLKNNLDRFYFLLCERKHFSFEEKDILAYFSSNFKRNFLVEFYISKCITFLGKYFFLIIAKQLFKLQMINATFNIHTKESPSWMIYYYIINKSFSYYRSTSN